MEQRPYIGHTKVSRLGFGAWPLGNTAHGETMSIETGIALVKAALAFGINFFDTAPNYASGRSETILGLALEDHRKDVVINTKFGHHPEGHIDFDENKLIPSIEGSLKRLKTDYLDSVILHNPTFDVLEGKTRHFDILATLKGSGQIKGYGVSIDTKAELETVLNQQTVDVIELLYNVFAQSTRDLLETIKKRHIALIIKVPLDSGWLSGKYTDKSTFKDIRSRWTCADLKRRHALVSALKALVGSDDLTPYAMGFLWSYEAITTVIPGIRTEAQLQAHIKAMDLPFAKTLKTAFESFYDAHIAKEPLPW